MKEPPAMPTNISASDAEESHPVSATNDETNHTPDDGTGSASNPKSDTPVVHDLLDQVIHEFHEILSQTKDLRGLSSGYPELDALIDGLKPGQLFVIASRPGLGKTALLHGIVSHLALDEKIPGMVLSGEHTPMGLMRRLFFGRAKIAMRQLHPSEFNVTKADLQRMEKAAREIRNSGIIPGDARGQTVEALRDQARRHQKNGGLGFIAIDHIHLLRSDSERAKRSRKREFAEVVGGLKSMALELDIPIIALASLKPGADSMDEPCLHTLRGAAALESEADVIGIIHQPDPELESSEYLSRPWLAIVKNRFGPTGSVPLVHAKFLGRMDAGRRKSQESLGSLEAQLFGDGKLTD